MPTRQILLRRKAISNVSHLTRTMQIVSTAMFKSYYRRWQANMDYYDALAQAGYLLVSSTVPFEHPLLKANNSNRTVLMVIGSRAGLCGGYNAELWHLVQTHIELAERSRYDLEIVAAESRLVPYMQARGVSPKLVYKDLDELPSDQQIGSIAAPFIKRYMAGQIDAFSIVYMGFHSPGHQQAQTLTIMPLTDLIDHLITRAKAIWPWDLAFEDFYMSPSPWQIIDGIADMIIRGAIRACFLDAILSEHVARMMAMRLATHNAEQTLKDLTAQYNRLRQTQITSELMEIIGGIGGIYEQG